ncbi:molybdopterin-guanine dinucleotide biosynthesis protein A [Paramaledivibacter caminithermalis DSM 15212]|uniref:Probable molybdenum cofactor guanylyltransferase n=2 Tax=Paramaledivibacter TaxID=1884934 RepID=A0A1M6KVJ5_PARC5|nr:molybdopterin-guanine dinucleotide biosynthesis protein A [Paramaledivibacter caminithermalis DSM 15212]
MAGGKSSRLGFDKQLIRVGENYLIDIIIDNLYKFFDEIIIVTNKNRTYNNKNIIVMEDEIKNVGPLGGLYVGLKKSTSIYSYVIACDMPYINNGYIKYMTNIIKKQKVGYALITQFGQWIEPFNAFYSRGIVKYIEEHLNRGQRSIHSLMKKLEVTYINEKTARRFSPNWEMFYNINTKEELDEYLTFKF